MSGKMTGKASGLEKAGRVETGMGGEGNAPWDPDDSKYSCCCGVMRATTGAYAIGVLRTLNLLVGLFSYIPLIINFIDRPIMILALVLYLINAAIVIMLFYGLKTEKAAFLLPAVIQHGLGVVGMVILTVLCIVMVASGTSVVVQFGSYSGRDYQSEGQGVSEGVVIILIMVLCTGIAIWLFSVLCKAFSFLTDKSRHPTHGTVTASISTPVHTAYLPGYGAKEGAVVGSPGLAPPPYVAKA